MTDHKQSLLGGEEEEEDARVTLCISLGQRSEFLSSACRSLSVCICYDVESVSTCVQNVQYFYFNFRVCCEWTKSAQKEKSRRDGHSDGNGG